MALSPMMQHYLNVKNEYKDAIVFYRLGDFYEMFFDDAVTASKVLDLTLTGRDCGLETRAPMCGVPYHAADTYVARLIENGFKVAICEQLTTPAESKGMVERGVIKVITPGTVTEDNMLKEKSNNFIACVYKNKKDIGISWADITTGEFFTTQITGDNSLKDLQDTLVRIMPAEIICNKEIFEISKTLPCVTFKYVPEFSAVNDFYFDKATCLANIQKQLKTNNLKNFDIFEKTNAILSSGALLEYFRQTQKRELVHLNKINYINNSKYMVLDVATRKNLELTSTIYDGKKKGSLLGLIDKTNTSMGARMLVNFIEQPLVDIDEINLRLAGVEELINNQLLLNDLAENLNNIRDIERLSGKISYGSITPKECSLLNKSLVSIYDIKHILSTTKSEILQNIYKNLSNIDEVVKLLSNSIIEDAPNVIKDGGFIKEGFNEELDKYRKIKNNGSGILNDIEIRERERTGIKNLKLGYNKVFGYYLDVTKSYQHLVPSDYIRKQTLSTCERYITEELKEIENDILNAEDKIIKLETTLYTEIKNQLLEYVENIQKVAKNIALADALSSLAFTSVRYNYTKPTMVDNGVLEIKNGRHPVVEALLSDGAFVPNDTYLDQGENRMNIITGPNMAGKSTYMRQVALITLLAHIGSFVPAEKAVIPITDRIFTRVGASDNLAFSQSTFMVEMSEVANILNNATKNSLIILDEIGRGTSTYDGMSIAYAVVEYILNKIGAKTLFATHYHELQELEEKFDGVKNYRITVKEYNDDIIFLRKIEHGGANKSFGIQVAQLAGVKQEVILNAKAILNKLNSEDINKNKGQNVQKTAVSNEKPLRTLEKIKYLDINTISPLEAFGLLNELKEEMGDK